MFDFISFFFSLYYREIKQVIIKMKVKVIKNHPRTQTKYVTELLWLIVRIDTMRMACL